MSLYAVTNPATGEEVSRYESTTDAEVSSAIAAASAVFADWSARSNLEARVAVVRKVAALHRERSDELAAIITREMGKPIGDAAGEVGFAADILDYYADNAERFLADEKVDALAGSAVIRKSALGPLLGIMPWNFPYYQVARFAGPNLILGNTILLKHAPQCPESALAIQQMFDDAGAPKGAYTNLFISNEQASDIIADPRVRGISLTGSERAGAAVAEQAGRHLKKVVLELGGSDPFIVLSADDLDAVVEAGVSARLDNTGQSCNAAKRFIVIDSLYEEFKEKFTAAVTGTEVGDPTAPGTTLGPLSSLPAAERLSEQVERAASQGATVTQAEGAAREGAFFPTAVITDITPEMDAYTEEFFGPVAQLYKVSSEDEAIELANATPYGLGSYVWTTDPEQAARVADRIQAGMVFINEVLADSPELPFGGVKNSGFGREMGTLGIDEFVNKKLIKQP